MSAPPKPWADGYHRVAPEMVAALKAAAARNNVSYMAVTVVRQHSFTSANKIGKFDLTYAQIAEHCAGSVSTAQAHRACSALTEAGWWHTVTPSCSNGANGGPGRAPIRQITVGWWGVQAVEEPNHGAVDDRITARSEPNHGAVERATLRNYSKKKTPLPPKHNYVALVGAGGGECLEKVTKHAEVEHNAEPAASQLKVKGATKRDEILDLAADQMFRNAVAAGFAVSSPDGFRNHKRAQAQTWLDTNLQGPGGHTWQARMTYAPTHLVAQAVAAMGSASVSLIQQLDEWVPALAEAV